MCMFEGKRPHEIWKFGIFYTWEGERFGVDWRPEYVCIGVYTSVSYVKDGVIDTGKIDIHGVS